MNSETPPIRPPISRLRALAVSLGMVVAYMTVRSIVYAIFPAGNGLQWIVRDTIMDLPRLFFLILAWRYGRRLWKKEQLGLHRRKAGECALIGFLFCATVAARPLFFHTTHAPLPWLLVLITSSFIVGFFEEILFRSLVLRALFDQYGASAAVWGSSLAFMCFHLQAQNFRNWPQIFVFAICFALMRINGVTIWGLALVHSIYDTLAILFEPVPDYPPFWLLSAFLVTTYVTAMYFGAYRRKLVQPAPF